jgi:hypothetical protein
MKEKTLSLQDRDGKPSFKRKYGARLINTGLMLCIANFALSYLTAASSSVPVEISLSLIGMGALLGGGGSVLEWFAQKRKV